MLDGYYDRKFNEAKAGKDSIFEPCKILSFDPETLTATVYFTRSSKERENVLVLFPSFNLTSGVLSIPSENTTALAFWGPDRQAYVLPAQYLLGRNEVNGGVVKQSASPQNFDPDLSYAHLRPGEQYIFSPGGHFHLDQDGNIEIMNKEMCFLRIEEDGTLRTAMARSWEETDFHSEKVFDFQDGKYRGSTSDLVFYKKEFDEDHVAGYAANIATAIAQSKDGADITSVLPESKMTVLRERSGMVSTGTWGDGEWIKMTGDAERVVKEWAVDGVTIRIGERGMFEIDHQKSDFRLTITSEEGLVKIERPDHAFQLTVEEDDVYFEGGGEKARLSKVIDRLLVLSRLHDIEEGLE